MTSSFSSLIDDASRDGVSPFESESMELPVRRSLTYKTLGPESMGASVRRSLTYERCADATDALFARLDDQAAAIVDRMPDDDSVGEEDGSGDGAEDGLDVWSLLYGWK
jgi:hypothetical protein